MKTYIPRILVSFGAAMMLPVGIFAAENTSPSGSANHNAQTQSPAQSAPAANGNDKVLDGLIVQDGQVYFINRVQFELALPGGAKLEPNGMIKEANGKTRSVGPGEMLTYDGQMEKAPIPSSGTESKTTMKDQARTAVPPATAPFHQVPQSGIDSSRK
jgi:hypothetical protein